VLVTCSSIGEGVTTASGLFDFPVVRMDEAMAEKAVSIGKRVGVPVTLRTTLEPTTELVRRKASGGDVTVVDVSCEVAFQAVMAGDGATHDTILTVGSRQGSKRLQPGRAETAGTSRH
jgi:Asp/Glu/hydantoin racemase